MLDAAAGDDDDDYYQGISCCDWGFCELATYRHGQLIAGTNISEVLNRRNRDISDLGH